MSLFVISLWVLQLSLSSQGPLSSRGTWSTDCPACKALPGLGAAPLGPGTAQPQRPRPPGAGQAAVLGRGDSCGVYTLGSCTRGLRCLPPGDEARPLQALLEGRGVCSESSPTTRIHSGDLAPNEPPENTPCRRLLLTVMRGLEGQLFQSLYDLYIPNCDKRGFFKKKQCRSAKAVGQRGSCWFVDENGAPATSSSAADGGLTGESR